MCGPVTYNITVMPSHGMMMMINDTVYNIIRLYNNTNYIITVYATNNAGHGEPATVTVRTRHPPPGSKCYLDTSRHNYTCNCTYNDNCPCKFSLALVITNHPMNVTVCSGTKANISCGYTGADPFIIRPNWRIIKRDDTGSVINNKTVSGVDIRKNKIGDLRFVVHVSGTLNNADGSYLSVGPVDDTYNNTSYQCIFTINDNIIESDTAGTITVIGM